MCVTVLLLGLLVRLPEVGTGPVPGTYMAFGNLFAALMQEEELGPNSA